MVSTAFGIPGRARPARRPRQRAALLLLLGLLASLLVYLQLHDGQSAEHAPLTAARAPEDGAGQIVYMPALLYLNEPTPTPTPSATPSPTPTGGPATPTATTTPGCADRFDPDLIVTQAALPLQPVGTPFVDPVFCSSMRRVSSTSDAGSFETQEYSQLQAFSADNAYILLTSSSGYRVRERASLALVAGLDTSGWNAARWYAPQPHVLVYFDDNADTTLRVRLSSVDALTTTTLFTFPTQYQRVITVQSSDELSEDGRWLAGVAQRGDGERVIFALDLQSRQLGAQLPIDDFYVQGGACDPDPEWGNVQPDWVGVSPLGRYLVVQWTRDGTSRCSGLETFNLQTGAFAGRVYDGHQHGDLGVDLDGGEFYMTFEFGHPSGEMALGMRRLPGTATVSAPTYLRLIDWYNGEHISCRGPAGVCLVTAAGYGGNGRQPFERELFLLHTDGGVERLAHHHSSSCGYWVQPRASMSRDGSYVIFASDWGRRISCDDYGRGDPYLIER